MFTSQPRCDRVPDSRRGLASSACSTRPPRLHSRRSRRSSPSARRRYEPRVVRGTVREICRRRSLRRFYVADFAQASCTVILRLRRSYRKRSDESPSCSPFRSCVLSTLCFQYTQSDATPRMKEHTLLVLMYTRGYSEAASLIETLGSLRGSKGGRGWTEDAAILGDVTSQRNGGRSWIARVPLDSLSGAKRPDSIM
jgi:hypothetical protein